jgi:hypothetical protein
MLQDHVPDCSQTHVAPKQPPSSGK